MEEIATSRRGFLLGLGAAIAAVPTARLLKGDDLWLPGKPLDVPGRKSTRFDVLADPTSTLEVEKQRVRVTVEFWGDVQFGGLEAGQFPTGYIPTTSEKRTREADNIYIESTAIGPIDFSSPMAPMTSRGFINGRKSPAWDVVDGKLIEYAPGENRFEKGLGLRVEEKRTNLLLYSAKPPDQQFYLAPGAYSLSWYGDGKVRVSGNDLVLAYDSEFGIKDVKFFNRRLSDDELRKLTT